VLAARQRIFHRRAQGAVHVAVHLGMLDEGASRISSRKRAGERKWYSRPSTSPGRGVRVVAETEKRTRGSCSKSLQSVDLPLPDGPEMTIICPRRGAPVRLELSAGGTMAGSAR
jgi:hypothetical protein